MDLQSAPLPFFLYSREESNFIFGYHFMILGYQMATLKKGRFGLLFFINLSIFYLFIIYLRLY